MAKRAVYLFLLGALCVTTALASSAKGQIQYKLNGKHAGADFTASITGVSGGIGGAYFTPEQFPDGTWGYYVDIDWADPSNH